MRLPTNKVDEKLRDEIRCSHDSGVAIIGLPKMPFGLHKQNNYSNLDNFKNNHFKKMSLDLVNQARWQKTSFSKKQKYQAKQEASHTKFQTLKMKILS